VRAAKAVPNRGKLRILSILSINQ